MKKHMLVFLALCTFLSVFTIIVITAGRKQNTLPGNFVQFGIIWTKGSIVHPTGQEPMYIVGPPSTRLEDIAKLPGVTYKERLARQHAAAVLWGNGRFRLVGDCLEVGDYEHLPEILQDRDYGCEFGVRKTSNGTVSRFILTPFATEDVRRIRYTNGIVYCVGGDAPIYVDIKKEYWWVALHPEMLPSPHKEEFAKLKTKDKNNFVWIENNLGGGHWVCEE